MQNCRKNVLVILEKKISILLGPTEIARGIPKK